MGSSPVEPALAGPTGLATPTGQIAKIALGAQVGSFIDWYDFFLSAVVSAVVWPSIFFNFLSGPAALAASVGTYVVSYFTRPLGALLFGHYGDRVGRKSVLVLTLLLSGGSILGIALTPGYASIGVLGAVLLVTFRLLFGLALGGEFGGAQAWITEFSSKTKRRGLWNSIVLSSLPLGIFAAAGAFVLTIDNYGGKNFIAYAWRYPFVVGAIIVVIGIVIRYRLEESPLFANLENERKLEPSPIKKMFKDSWKILLPLFFVNAAGLSIAIIEGNGPIPLAFLGSLKVSNTDAITAQAIGALVAVPACIAGGALSDIIGRRKTILISAVLMMAVAYPAYLLMATKSFGNIALAQVLVACSWVVGTGSSMGAFFSEQFPTRYRVTGAGFAFNVSSLIGSVSGGILAPYVIGVYGISSAFPMLVGVNIALAAVAGLSLLFTKETKGSQLQE